MRQFSLVASGVGGAAALAGFCVAYRLDYPVGPTDVALLGVIYAVAFLGRKAFERVGRRKGLSGGGRLV
jgi:ABC-type Mn2+/Zn2+ transport system permease subunit